MAHSHFSATDELQGFEISLSKFVSFQSEIFVSINSSSEISRHSPTKVENVTTKLVCIELMGNEDGTSYV